MTPTRRFLIVLAAALVVETGVFAVYYDDLLFLRRPVSTIVTEAEAVFARRAREALDRRTLTPHHLQTIVDAARGFGRIDLEREALERLTEVTPDDRSVQLRLADVLRRSGELMRAEALYLHLLESSE